MKKLINYLFKEGQHSQQSGPGPSDETPELSTPPPSQNSPHRYFDLGQIKISRNPAPAAPATSQKKTNIPLQTERYEIRDFIGEGGTAKVFRAYDAIMKREVAMKRFKPEYDSLSDQSDYLAEMETLSKFDHPNIVSAFDVGRDASGEFIVTSLIVGHDLQQAISKEPLDVSIFCELVMQSLEGLMACHVAGVLHLDLKPGNIMMSRQNSGRTHFQLIDFGRAKSYIDDTVRHHKAGKRGLNGSIHYMSPEQLSEHPLDPRSDLYSLGCVFYYALAGQRPFEGDSVMQVMASHIMGKYTPLNELCENAPLWICQWVHTLISKDPDMRPADANEALAKFNEGQAAHSASPGPR